MRTLILYATDHGQTQRIAERIGTLLDARKMPSDQHNIAIDPSEPIAVDAYDAVIVGSPIHFSHYDVRLSDYLKEYRTALREIPSAFFSVSLGILSDDASEQNEIESITNAYLADTNWNPSLRCHFGGAIRYSRYGWLKRKLMQLFVRKAGGPTDTQFDYEFTDWNSVEQFVDQFAEFVEGCKEPDEDYSQRNIYSKPARRYSIQNQRKSVITS